MTDLKTDVDTGTLEKERLVWVVNAPHPLAGGLAAGLRMCSMTNIYTDDWGKLEPSAIVIALARGEGDKAVVFGYEKGATMHSE